jgi:hypothetical protein
MRKELIEVGKTYRDSKGNARKIHKLRQLDVYSWAVLVEYQVTEGRKPRSPDAFGAMGEELFRCDILAFQRWAKTQD